MSSFAPSERVLVSPRHLAGAGLDHLRNALGPLVHLFGWSAEHDAATGRIALDSPDHSLLVDFDPSRFDGTWWTIAHHEPYWKAEFSRQTPVEAVASLTQCLPQLLGDRRHAERIPLTDMNPAEIAGLNDWSVSPGGNSFASPDGHCILAHTPDAEASWTFAHCLDDGFDTHWNATFTRDTPQALVAQFFTRLSSTAPVEREFSDVPYLARAHNDALITPVRGASVNPHTHHALAQVDRLSTARRR